MPTHRFNRVYQSPVMDLAQSKHKILANASAAAQEMMNFAGAVYPFTVANNAASSPYSVLEAFLLIRHGIMLSGAGILMPA
jgi:hypothetical protein